MKIEKKDEGDLIFGRHPVLDLLRSEGAQKINKLWLMKGGVGRRCSGVLPVLEDVHEGGGGTLDEIVRLAKEKNIVFQWVERSRLNKITRTTAHQGVAARATVVGYRSLDDLFSSVRNPSPILLLDGIEDPHNLGAILRNAAFFGAKAVAVPRWRSAGLSGTVMKTSAGAMARVPMVQVANIAQTILYLKKRDFWIYGADMKGDSCSRFSFNDPFALVIGAEGKGLHHLVKERCDALVSVPGTGEVESLNASCASAVLLYEIAKQKK